MPFLNTHNLGIKLQKVSKPFFKTIQEASYDQILIWIVLNALPHFARKRFLLCHSKISKKFKIALFKSSEHLFLSSRQQQNHVLRSFLWSIFDWNNFERFASISQKTVSTSSLKSLQKTEKYAFEMLRTFVFELKVPSKPFSKKLPMIKFWFK